MLKSQRVAARFARPSRSHFVRGKPFRAYSSGLSTSSSSIEAGPLIRFTREHLWIRADNLEDLALISLGVSNAKKDRLGQVAAVQLAGNPGLHMPQGALISIITHLPEAKEDEDFGVELSAFMSQTEIRAPVSGEIVEINEAIERDPAAFLSPDPDQSWLYKLKLATSAEDASIKADTMDADEYKQYLIKLGWI